MSLKNLPTLAQVQARRSRAQPKPGQAPAKASAPARRQRLTRRERPRTRKKREGTAWVRDHVFRRERDLCRICGPTKARPAESRHEIKARGAGGQITPENALAACGSGTTGCHGFAQLNQIKIQEGVRLKPGDPRGAEGELLITPTTSAAADWLGVAIGHTFSSRPIYRPYRVIA